MKRHVLSQNITRRISILVCLILLFLVLSADASSLVAMADSQVLKWTIISTPSNEGKVIVSPSEVHRIAIGSDGKTFYALDIANGEAVTGRKALYKTIDGGISWSDKVGTYLVAAGASFPVWDITIAPDDPNFIIAVTDDGSGTAPTNVWVSMDGGSMWRDANFPTQPLLIGAIAISPSYGDKRSIAVGTRYPSDGSGGEVYVLSVPFDSNWEAQGFNGGDVLAVKFSPNYFQDFTLTVVAADANDTKLHIGFHSLANNTTQWNMVEGYPVEVSAISGASPGEDKVVTADLELPSDFNGDEARTRRYFVSYDAPTSTVSDVYRLDDTIVYRLNVPVTGSIKRVSNIAYFGTTTEGKLLAGEVIGNMCQATVGVYYTLEPLACRSACWLPSRKPPTGGAGSTTCTMPGWGNAQLAWTPDGKRAYCGTSSANLTIPADWPIAYKTGKNLDESAFSVTCNDGFSWNQLSFIDTEISHLAEIAPAADGSIFYLASVSENDSCAGFDSVWRSPNSDRKGKPIGDSWERILCLTTADRACATDQTDKAILRLAGDKPDGSTVFWAAQGAKRILWSSDFGDIWSVVNPAIQVQDLAAETENTLYALDSEGFVQKIARSGINWTYGDKVPTCLGSGYSIATAYTGMTPDNDKGHVIVGGTGTGTYDVAYSTDGGATFTIASKPLPSRGETLVIASSSYNSDGTILAVVPSSSGIYAWGIYSGKDLWEEWWWTGVVGLEISRNYGFYFSCPATSWAPGPYIRWNLAMAGLDPNVDFGNEPSKGLRLSGGLEVDQPVTVWMIDRRDYDPPVGGIWAYIDSLNWLGPAPVTPASLMAIDCDLVSGRAGEINLKWEQRSLSKGYQIQVAEDRDFSVGVVDIGGDWAGPFYTPWNLEEPGLVIPPGGGGVTDGLGNSWIVPALEAGKAYHWRVKVREVATGDYIDSPWSWTESFVVKAGFKVKTPYLGVMPVSPENGKRGVCIEPVSFSWTSCQNTTGYQFQLAEDAAMTKIVVDVKTSTTAYELDKPLGYGKNYFWRIRALEPVPSDWSSVFTFCTEEASPQVTPSPVTSVSLLTIPSWVWVVSTFLLLTLISVFLLMFRL